MRFNVPPLGGYGWEEDHEDGDGGAVESVTRSLDPTSSNPAELIDAMRAIEKRQFDLAKANRDLTEQLDNKVNDYKELKQRLAEVQAQAVAQPHGEDKGLKRYIGEGGGVRLRGGVDPETGDYTPGIFDDTTTRTEWQQEAQRAAEDIQLFKAIKGAKAESPRLNKRMAAILNRAPEFIKRAPGWEDKTRAFVDSSAAGAEWIIDLGLPEVGRDPRLRSDLEARFRVKEMAAQTELLPYMTTALRPYKKSAASGDDPAQFTSSSMATAQRTISATGMVVRAQVDRDAADDAIIAALPFIREELVNAHRDGFEDCLLNGDTAATHGDTGLASWDIRNRWGATGLGGSGDHRRTFLGFRQKALDISGASGNESAAETYAGMVTWRTNLAAPSGVLDGLLYVVSPEWYLVKMVAGMAEFKTFDVVAGMGANESGIINRVAGVPVLVSEYMDANFTTAGIYDGNTTTKTAGLLINTTRYWVTRRQGVMIEVDTDITRDIHNLVSKDRKGLFDIDNGGKKNVYYAYNLSKS